MNMVGIFKISGVAGENWNETVGLRIERWGYWRVSRASPSRKRRNQMKRASRFANVRKMVVEDQAATHMSSNVETQWSQVKGGGSRAEQPLSSGW